VEVGDWAAACDPPLPDGLPGALGAGCGPLEPGADPETVVVVVLVTGVVGDDVVDGVVVAVTTVVGSVAVVDVGGVWVVVSCVTAVAVVDGVDAVVPLPVAVVVDGVDAVVVDGVDAAVPLPVAVVVDGVDAAVPLPVAVVVDGVDAVAPLPVEVLGAAGAGAVSVLVDVGSAAAMVANEHGPTLIASPAATATKARRGLAAERRVGGLMASTAVIGRSAGDGNETAMRFAAASL